MRAAELLLKLGCHSIQLITVLLKALGVRTSHALYALFIAATVSRYARAGKCDQSIWIEFGGLQ